MKRLLLTIAISILLSGCSSFTPSDLASRRTPFGQATERTNQQQLLENLVRLHFLETPIFLSINGISDSSSIGASPIVPSQFNIDKLTGALGKLSYKNGSSITYRPQSGKKFADDIMYPIPLRSVYLINHGGMSSNTQLFRMIAASANNISNANLASTLGNTVAPCYRRFAKLINALDELNKLHGYSIRAQLINMPKTGGKLKQKHLFNLILHINSKVLYSKPADQIRRILRQKPGTRDIIISSHQPPSKSHHIYLKLRSYLGTMVFLSHAVDTPPSLRSQLPIVRNANGSPFNWQPLMRPLLHIRYSPKRPLQGTDYISIYQHGYWFYISEKDFTSKETLTTLSELRLLTTTNKAAADTVFTVPLNQ